MDSSTIPVSQEDKALLSKATDVSHRFEVLIKLYGYTCAIKAFNLCLQVLNHIVLRNKPIKLLLTISSILDMNYLVQFSAMIINHVYRLRHSGKVCSGDFLSEEVDQADEIRNLYLIYKGGFLYGWLMFYWVISGIVGVGFCVACCCGLKADDIKQAMQMQVAKAKGQTS